MEGGELVEFFRPDTGNQAEAGHKQAAEHRKGQHEADVGGHGQAEPGGADQNAEADGQAADDAGADVGREKGGVGNRRQQDKHQIAGNPRLNQAGRRVGKGVLHHAHHGEAGNQEGVIRHAGQRFHVFADGLRENQLIEQRSEYRRAERLLPHFAKAHHFFAQQGRKSGHVHAPAPVRLINTCSKSVSSISICCTPMPAVLRKIRMSATSL